MRTGCVYGKEARRFGSVFFRPALHKVVIQVAKLCNGNQRVLGEREKPLNNAAGGDGPLVGVHFLLAAFARPARLGFGGVALLAEAGVPRGRLETRCVNRRTI